MICHYWFFCHGFKFQDSVCNCCNGLPMLSVNISDIAVLLPLLKMLIIVVLFITLVNLNQISYLKILCLQIVGIYKNAYQENSIKTRVYNYNFDNLVKVFFPLVNPI